MAEDLVVAFYKYNSMRRQSRQVWAISSLEVKIYMYSNTVQYLMILLRF